MLRTAAGIGLATRTLLSASFSGHDLSGLSFGKRIERSQCAGKTYSRLHALWQKFTIFCTATRSGGYQFQSAAFDARQMLAQAIVQVLANALTFPAADFQWASDGNKCRAASAFSSSPATALDTPSVTGPVSS